MNTLNKIRLALAGAALLTLTACGGGGGVGSADTGTLRLALTDAPACGFDHVFVTVQKVRVHQSGTALDSDGGWSEIVLNPARIDLLTLTNGVLSELGQLPLAPGKYTQMRLVLAENGSAAPWANSVVPTGDTTEAPLTTPSGQKSGVKIGVHIDIEANKMADFVLDFDPCKSISVVGSGKSDKYHLKPQLRLIPRYVNGVLGFVDPSLANGLATASLQHNGVPVRSTVSDDKGRFLLQPVDPGTYTLVVTAPGKTTTVVTGVPVVAATVTSLNSVSTALVPASSATGILAGTVTTTAAANLRALQFYSATGEMEVRHQPLPAGGAYSYTLPVAAPQVAPYVAQLGTLAFVPYAAAAGSYTLQATADGLAPKSVGPLAVPSGGTLTTNFAYP